MKRIWSILLTMTVALTLLCPMTAYAATGEGNIDGGGGNLGDATSHGSWNPGNEGVRVTIVRSDDHAVVSTPIDLTNRAPAASIYHFGKVSKLQYTNGVALSPVQGSYTCIKPTQAVPRIISTNGRNNIEAIKSYFTDEQVIRAIANYSGMDFDTLIGGEDKILLEPIAYYKFEGVMIATTATEAVLYDEIVGGQLRYWMGSLTAKNLPLSMFLETPDLGYPAWSGATNKNASNADIKSSLGLGIVRFEEQPEIVWKKIKGDYLVDHEKYINAIQVYQETLKDTEENETNMGSQFTGSIYNNMGCAYASLFQMNEALTCFQKANEELHTKASLKSWLFAVYMSKGQDAYEQMCTERKVDAETKREMDRQITEAMHVELPRDLDEALAAWTREYHKNTGL